MYFLSRGKLSNQEVFDADASWPDVAVLMAAHNEEKVIESKLKSLLSQNYKGQLKYFIGSDNSTDKTNEIITTFQEKEPAIYFINFEKRRGKPAILNDLNKYAQSLDNFKPTIYIITDANVILDPSVIQGLVQHFKNDQIGLVDAHMIYTDMVSEGISKAESSYLVSEMRLKDFESKVGQRMIGPFGGCYAIRAKLFKDIPDNFLVDDFYLAMNVFKKGFSAINELSAKAYEPVTHGFSQEFKRKKRIGAGNFQNVMAYPSLMLPFSKVGFNIFSHKLLRWLGPFFLLGIFISFSYFSFGNDAILKVISIIGILGMIAIPLLDWILTRFGLNFMLLRGLNYFLIMNIALLMGFIKFLKGIDEGKWDRTERTAYQSSNI